MLLAVDIGNTKVGLGIFDNDSLRATWKVTTDIHKMADEYAVTMLNLFTLEGIKASDIEDVIICSVVPPMLPIYESLCGKYFRVSPLVVGAGIRTGVKIATDNPREVGTDRVVNAAAAHKLYGDPVIVIDFGTATTLDAVSADGDYLGGAIAPGMAISAEALCNNTAQLPPVELVHPRTAIGRNTITAMQSGIVFGYVGLIEGLVNRIRKELGGNARVIATGSYAETIAKETKSIEKVVPNLTLMGLHLIYKMNKYGEKETANVERQERPARSNRKYRRL